MILQVHEVAVMGSKDLLKYALAVEPFGVREGTLPTHTAAIWGWADMIAPMIEHGYVHPRASASQSVLLQCFLRQPALLFCLHGP